ncbi:hypothetical protein EDEG_02643 [Edhazardia aedis USNM 41457]|uniref:Uncharacterized protein n=1 Tax=Edhazardia aedis (strain USNM 41457) TaxID=1003232 RepID=J9D633_EDHAE|nr:hypothetical protein EDEG_02643 [Edhazardia aedis USNM 41457]|eukprot:EJW02999.1 hypothetical protein EDEG_02643 [Edhazardia aedis USNM 41457]
MGLLLALAIYETVYGDSLDFKNQQTILSERIDTNMTDFYKYNEDNLKMKYGDISDIHGCENYGGKDAKILYNYIMKYLPFCDLYQQVASLMALHILYSDTKIKNHDLFEQI